MNEARLLDEFDHWTLRLQDPFDKCACRTLLLCAKKPEATPGLSVIARIKRMSAYLNNDQREMCAAVLKIASRGELEDVAS